MSATAVETLTLGQLSLSRTIDEITETNVGGRAGSTCKTFGRDCASVIHKHYSLVMHHVDDWDGEFYKSEDGSIWAKVK